MTAKYFDGGYSGHVTVGKDGFGFRTECVVHLDSGIVFEADAMAADAYRLVFKSAYVATICGIEQDLPQDSLPEHLRLGRACSLVFARAAAK